METYTLQCEQCYHEWTEQIGPNDSFDTECPKCGAFFSIDPDDDDDDDDGGVGE